jgi:hypothetical protein
MLRFPLVALRGCVTGAVLLIGCQSPVAPNLSTPPPPPPPPAQSFLSVEIAGPSRIDANGRFGWEAYAFGGSGEYHYLWEVTRQPGQPATPVTIERKLSLLVTETDGNLVLRLTVTSGNQVKVESFGVRNCIGGCDVGP